ncbi:MAG: hypothetical protein K2N72_06350 [Oscillospiraceae bacterium]|nr:hypothetical protein [Oscillospiraceae bacterium]
MKRVFKIFAAMLMIGTLCGCGESSENNTAEIPPETEESTTVSEIRIPDGYTVFEGKTNAIDSVTMELINFDDSSAKYKIYNDLDREIDTGIEYELQIQLNGSWYSLPYIYNIEGSLGYGVIIGSGCSNEYDVKWENIYGKLEPGH